jgi:peptidoglycan/LPS O-acetylase OafA/YrhL
LTLFGRKLFKFAIFFLGMAAFVFLSMLFMYSTFFDKKTDPAYGWGTLAISIILGALVGLILAKLSKIGVAVLAGWGGFSLGLILWSSFLYYINS